MRRFASIAGRGAPVRRTVAAPVLAIVISTLAGCGGGGNLPPVFSAVFGLENADAYPYRLGRVPRPSVETGDRLVGGAAGQPGQCIYADDAGERRFRAACPEGFSLSPE